MWGLGNSGASGSPAGDTTFRRLKKPVVLPLSAVAEPWQSEVFSATCRVPKAKDHSAHDVLLKGVLLRLPATEASDGAVRVKAFCLMCPHELCYVKLMETGEPARLPPEAKRDHPLFMCPCHSSAFDPLADGARISGPAPRGLYRFRVEVKRDRVEIREVETAALS